LPELHRLSIGPDLVFGRLWAETGCRDVLKSLVADREFSFDVERAVYLTVLHRLMVSGSDRHANDWCSRVRVPGAEGLDLDHAYEAMAWLGEVDAADRSTAEAVEEVATASRCSVPFRSRFSTPRHCGSKALLRVARIAAGEDPGTQ